MRYSHQHMRPGHHRQEVHVVLGDKHGASVGEKEAMVEGKF